jgi:gluconokinase
MSRRDDHFMPPSLAKSQFEALEPPMPEEHALVVRAENDLEHMVRSVLGMLSDAPAKTLG